MKYEQDMNETEEKADKILTEKMKDTLLEVPSVDFTSRVMAQVEAASTSSKIATTYVPLISKKIWVIISISFISIIGYTYFSGSEVSGWNDALPSLKSSIDISNINLISWSSEIPNVLIYGTVILSILILIEIPILKRQLKL